jgi:Protein of unknown function (DUF3833)
MLKRVDDKTGFAPALDLAAWFTGKTSASGLFEDRFGRLKRSFVVDVTGHPNGSGLTLEEDFRYDDGVLERRVWMVPVGGRQIAMRFDDRMVLMPDNTLLACARVSKFSVAIGQVFIAFRKA